MLVAVQCEGRAAGPGSRRHNRHMTRLMADPAFRRAQEEQLHLPHIAPITSLVDDLRKDGEWAPYVAPLHGGIHARMMTLLRDPGPMTRQGTGSGMLCTENNDQTAAKQCELMAEAGLTAADLTPWNAYPWYINRPPTKRELRRGAGVISSIVALMPELRVVLLTGRDAQAAWDLAAQHDSTLRSGRFAVLRTFHASVQALQAKDPLERARRVQHRIDTWCEAGLLVHGAK